MASAPEVGLQICSNHDCFMATPLFKVNEDVEKAKLVIYGQSYKHLGRNMGYFQVRYDSRVVIYNQKMFIRLATDK